MAVYPPASENLQPEAASHPSGRGGFARGVLVVVGITSTALLGLLLLWLLRRGLALAAAGLLLAIFFRRLALWISRRSRLRYGWSLALVLIGLVVLSAGAVWWRGPELGAEVARLEQELPEAVQRLKERLAEHGWGQTVLDRTPDSDEVLGSRAESFSWATSALSSLVDTLGALLIVLLSGVFVAATPSTYVRGLLHLVPLGGRPRAQQVVMQVEDALGRWILSKVLRMFLVGVLTWVGLALLNVPLALTLGIIAGLLTFIPNIGPILALVPAVLLALMEGPMRALYVVALYVGIQQVENNIVTPLLEKKMLSLPPALTLAMQVFMGILVGPVGVALASPLTAAGLVMVRMLYVEDVLHDHSATP